MFRKLSDGCLHGSDIMLIFAVSKFNSRYEDAAGRAAIFVPTCEQSPYKDCASVGKQRCPGGLCELSLDSTGAVSFVSGMNEIATIQQKIHTLRGQRVMLDFDLAEAYGVETKVLNQAVKRNIERFPEDFMFRLSKEEWNVLRSQFVTIKNGRGEHKKYMPFAFTEHGVAMLSSVLRSPIAIQVNIGIIRTFITMRQAIASMPDTRADVQQLRSDFEQLKRDIEDCLHDQNDINESTRMQLDSISLALAELQPREPKPRRRIGFIQE